MRRHFDQVTRIWATAALVAWIALAAFVVGSTGSASAAADGGPSGLAPAPAEAAVDRPATDQRRDTPQTTVDDVSSSVMCPSCDTTLDQSNSPAAERMRTWVEEAVAAGWTEQEIRDGLVQEYDGDESILATPRASGLGLLAWLVPALVTLVAAIGGALLMRRWRHQTRSGSSSYAHASASPSASSSSPNPSTDEPGAAAAPSPSPSR